jgi:hypothetical protein
MADENIAEQLIEAMYDAGRDGIEAIVGHIVESSKADLPIGDPAVDPDPAVALRDSYHVRWVSVRGVSSTRGDWVEDGGYVSISVEAAYAVKQHEALHFKHPRGGRAKFLERHVTAASNDLQESLTASVRTHLAGGRTRVRAGEGLRA